MSQNVQTTVGGGVRAKSERPNFLRPYLPKGGGDSGVLDNVQNLVGFFFIAPLEKFKLRKQKQKLLQISMK